VFLVIKIEKVLQQGDISDCAEPYKPFTKETDVNKIKEKAKANAEQFCDKFGNYRMPFLWTGIHLIDVISEAAGGGDTSNQGAEKEQPFNREINTRRNTEEPEGTRSSLRRGDPVSRRASNSAEVGKPTPSKPDRPKSGEEEETMNLANFRAITLTVSTFFKQESDRLSDEDLFKILADLRRPSSLVRRLKCIPGTLKLDISAPPDKLMYCLTPELLKVYPYPDNQSRPVKEIQEFAPKEVFVPYVNYRNTLYVYPTHLNFSNRGGSAKNIAVKVQFMAGEDPDQALTCIYGKSSGPELVKEVWTSITYHNKTPDFYEEVKVKLPPNLDEKHHLLFTFYHISFKSEGSGSVDPTPVGYTWLPALRESRLQLGDFSLPVAVEKLPSSYSVLSTEVQLPGMKWVDGHKGIFNCSVHTESSVHTQDIYIHRFFRFCHQAEGRLQVSSSVRGNDNNSLDSLRKSIKDLDKAQEEPLVRFLHLIIDKLLMLLVRPPVPAGTHINIGQAAFEALNQVVHRVQVLSENSQDKHGKNSLLSSYASFAFNMHLVSSPPVSPPASPLGHHSSDSKQSGTGSLHGARTLSTSNPSLGEALSGHGHSLSVAGMREPWISEQFGYHNIPGNRSSVAEGRNSRAGMAISPFSGSNKLVHEELALQWAVASLPFKEMAMTHAWFFFELMVKSMAQYLETADKFFYPRKERFHERYLDDVSALVNSVTLEIIRKQEKNFKNARMLNASLGFFLNDIISLMDRGFVLMLVRNYMKEMNSQGFGNPNISFLKLELLHILCTHEHFVILNLPFPCNEQSPNISPSPSMSSIVSSVSSFSLAIKDASQSLGELSMEFREQHFLIGLLLCELKNSFDSNEQDLMKQAVDVIRDLIASHDLDPRYDSVVCRNRIAALYVPLIAIVMDVLTQLSGYESEKDSVISEDVAMAIAMSSVPIPRSMMKQDSRIELQTQKSRLAILNPDSTRGLLLCCLWVFKNIDQTTLKQWWLKLPSGRLGQLLEVLDLCIKLFEYPGTKATSQKGNSAAQQAKKTKVSDSKARLQTLEEAILNRGAAKEMLQRHRTAATNKDESPKLRWRKEHTYWKKTNEQGQRGEFSVQVQGTLAAECSLIVLDALELLVQTILANDNLRVVLNTVKRVVLHALACNQSTEVLKAMFATQRSIVRKVPELLFEVDTELCADLCYRLLNHCCSSLSEVRLQGSASLYLLMRQNFEIGNNFARVKMQVTMSLSTLVGSTQCFNEEYLRRSLKTIITYAQTDQQLKLTPFPEQVRELVFNLHMILSDTVKMKEYQEDPEMLIDLMYRIAKGYQNSPDLRLTWLQNMAAKHTDSGCHVEAGMCLVHSAALVSEYLYMVDDKGYLPIGCVDFEGISYNALEESAVSDDIVSPEEEGICSGKYFCENGVVGLLEQAAYSFTMASMFELVNEVYKILIKIYEAKRDHKKLMNVHEKLADGFRKIVQSEGKRMMGTYFRVGFYGARFGDIDGEEFIYKEPAITKLPEISHRLQSFYGDKFGYEVVDVIKDSSVVDPNRLDPAKAYIQITYVEPLFEDWELVDRITYFDKNNDLRRFVFATPFTPSGKAHGDLSSQHKRKTILTVSNAFPYIKTRINVIQREEVVLSPIEVAIEDIQLKTKELCQACETEPPDAKMLQMVLQGCVGTTVNQGPMEIANVFLADFEKGNNESAAITRNHHKLRLCFKEFVKRSNEALLKNKTLITAEQKAYQKELEKNYKVFVDKLEPLLKSRFGTLRGSLRKKDPASS